MYKKSLAQLWCSSVSIGLGVIALQLATSWQYICLVAVMFGALSRSSDPRKCPIYVLGLVSGSACAALLRWNLTTDKSQLSHVGQEIQGYVGTVVGAVLVSLVVGHVIKVLWRRSHPMLVQRIN